MFDFLFPNHPFGGHALRLVAQAQQGGGDVFDIARAMKSVEAGDKAAWESAWLDLAEKTELRAHKALAARHTRTAGNISFMRATTTVCPTCCSRLRKSPSAESASANHRSSSAKPPSSTMPRSK